MILDENLFEAKSNDFEKISDMIYQALTRLGYLVNADKVGYAITKRIDPSKKLVSRQDKDFDFVTDEQLNDAKALLAKANIGYFVKRLLGQPTLYIDLTNFDVEDVNTEALKRSIEDRFRGWLRKLYTKKYKDKSDDEIIQAFLSFISHDATSDDMNKLKSVLARFKSDKEKMLTESVADLTSIKIPGYVGTWSPIDVFTTPMPDVTRYFLMENDKYGDETQYLVVSEDLSEIYETYDDIETALRDEGILESLDEDIVKTSKGKWVNKGKEGTHGEFSTKKKAREQQKAMFASGWKGESLGENIGSDIAEYQKWVDYDMKKYGKISDDTNEKIKKAGLKIVKDRYGDYEVIANEPIREDLKEPTIEEMFKYLKEYPQYNSQYTRPVKYYDLDLTPEQQDEFFDFFQDDADGVETFWKVNADLSQNIYQEGRMGGHLVLDAAILEPKIFDGIDSVDEMIQDELEHNYYPNNDDGTYDERQKQDAKEDVEKEIKDSYITLKDFDERVDKLIANLKATLDARIKNKGLNEDLEREFTIHYNREGFEFGGYGAVRVKAINEDEAKEKFYAEKKDDKITISFIRPTTNEDIRKGIRLLETKKVEESLKNNEVADFFDKAKKLGVKTLKDLKILLAQPESKGDSEKEKLDNYSKEANPDNKDLSEDVKVVDKNQAEIDKKAGLENLLNDLINDENEAINGYNSAIVNFELEGKSDLTNVFRDIIKDEQNHIGNLQKVLNEINPTTIANLEQGQQEAADTLNK